MKILHLVPSYWPAFERGGPIRSVHLLNKWLVKHGVDVAVYTTNIDLEGKVETNKEILIDGVKVWYFPLTWRVWQYSSALHKKLKQEIKNFDLVHITSTFLSASTLGAYYAKKFNKPYIISPRGNLMKEPLERKSPFKKRIYISLIEKKNLASASAIHFTTELEKKEYAEEKLPLKRAIVIYNSIEKEIAGNDVSQVKFREKYGIGENEKIVLSLGRLNWKKGLDTLIPAFAQVVREEPEALLVIAGPDEERYKKNIQLLITNYHLQDKVVFTGELLDKERCIAYKSASVFVLPSYSENFGMAVVEAMYFGLPIVITENVGIAPDVAKMNAGFVIKKDVDELSRAILEILADQNLAKKMGEAGKKLVQEEFSGEKVAEKWIRAYTDLVNEAANNRDNPNL